MFFRVILLISIFSLSARLVFAEDCVDAIHPEKIGDYTCYTQRVKDICESPAALWNQGGGHLAGIVRVDYPEFTKDSVAAILPKLASDPSQPIDPSVWGSVPGGPIVEVARRVYQKNMNTNFSCAIITDRVAQIQKIQTLIPPGETTDIGRKIQKESEKYLQMAKKLGCQSDAPETLPNQTIETRLRDTVTREYCSYDLYLDYLGYNIQKNYSASREIQDALGNKQSLPLTMFTVNADMETKNTAMDSERLRAEDTLPRALKAFREMKRTYMPHILLTLIYDDYLELRNNLDLYLSNVSQLFEKAHNAQDANKR